MSIKRSKADRVDRPNDFALSSALATQPAASLLPTATPKRKGKRRRIGYISYFLWFTRMTELLPPPADEVQPPASGRFVVRRTLRPLLFRAGMLLLCLSVFSPSLMLVSGEEVLVCNICGDEGGTIGRPDVLVQEPIGGTEVTCGELQDQADAGTFNALQCTILQFAMATVCGCTTPPPGQSPPTSSPVSAPETTEVPTAVPAETTSTEAPTGSPVQPSISNVTSELRIVFVGAAGQMNDNLTAYFEETTCAYLEDELSSEASGLTCVVLDQVLTDSELDVRMQVVAEQTTLESGEELANQLATTLTNNSDAYLAALSRPFFDDVTAVEASAVLEGGGPTAAPVAAAAPTSATTGSPVAAAPPSPAPAPTPRPTQPLLELQGRVDVRMEYLVGEMTGSIRESFENTTAAFLTSYLGTGSAPLLDIGAKVLYQVAEGGEEQGPTGKPVTANVAVTGKRQLPMDVEEVVTDTLNTYGAEYIMALQSSPSAPAQIYFKTVLNVTAAVAAAAPTSVPTVVPPAPTPSSGSSDSLSGGAIAGIVIGCLAFVAVVAFLVYYLRTDQAKPPPEPTGSRHSAVDLGSSDAPPNTGYSSSSPGRGSATQQRPSALKKSAAPPRREEAPLPTSAAAAALVATAGRDAFDDASLSQADEGADGTTMAPASNGDNDNDSFTYSLNDGLEPSQAPPPQQQQRAAGPGSSAPTTASSASGGGGGSSMGGSMSGVTSGATSGATASTASEDRMARKFKRTVIAPEGKLGIIIDTTVEGPIVYKVNASSPLEGVIFPGDLIVKIDDIETRAMSANNITTLMVQTAGQKRALTVLSDDPSR